jgi:hypothetical protein
MNDDRLSATITAQLDEDVAHLDAATLSRLNQARQRALAQRPGAARMWLFGGSALTACAMLLAVTLVWRGDSASSVDPVFDQELLAEADLELMEDLEFYAWLDQLPDELPREPS